MPGPSLKRLKETLRYDPETGVFTRLKWGKLSDRTGHVDKMTGYLRISVANHVYGAHQLAWLYMTGRWPTEIDHWDRDKLNNRWSNLREATSTQNKANRLVQRNSATGVKGVSLCRVTGRYRADIRVAGKSMNLGRRDTIAEASQLYAEAALVHFGEFARIA